MTYPKGMLTCPRCATYGTLVVLDPLDPKDNDEIGCKSCNWRQPHCAPDGEPLYSPCYCGAHCSQYNKDFMPGGCYGPARLIGEINQGSISKPHWILVHACGNPEHEVPCDISYEDIYHDPPHPLSLSRHSIPAP